MTYYPTEVDAEDARQLLDTALLTDEEQLALDRVVSAFSADEACDDEAADTLNNLRETDMPSIEILSQARRLPFGESVELLSSSTKFILSNEENGVTWSRSV